MAILQRRGYPIWHKSQGNWVAMQDRHCYAITKLTESEETELLSPQTLKTERSLESFGALQLQHWQELAVNQSEKKLKSSKRLTTSDRLPRYAFRHAEHPSWLAVFYGNRNLLFRHLCVTRESLYCRVCVRFAFFKAPGDLVHIVLGCYAMPRYLFSPAHSCCSFPSENNVITEVAEWIRPQLSF